MNDCCYSCRLLYEKEMDMRNPQVSDAEVIADLHSTKKSAAISATTSTQSVSAGSSSVTPPAAKSKKRPTKKVKLNDEKPADKPAPNHHSRFSLIIEVGKDHQGEPNYAFYMKKTKELDQFEKTAFTLGNVHIRGSPDSRAHVMLSAAQGSVNGWKRVDAGTVLNRMYIALFDYNSTIDNEDDDDVDTEQ